MQEGEKKYKEGISYGLWAGWLFGFAGLHRLYLGKYGTGFLWLFTWGLGGISALLAMLLAVTGALLMFRYDASVERAYSSIQFLETQVFFGSFLFFLLFLF